MPITKSMAAGDVISDFVHSSNKMFSGDSKKKRIKRALGAYYSMHKGKTRNEANDDSDHDTVIQGKGKVKRKFKLKRISEQLIENKDCKGQGKTTPTKIKDPLAKKKIIKGNPVKEDAVDEKYVGFNKLKAKIAAKGGVRNPGAVAAAIGRKKYGKKAMAKASGSGHSLKGHKTLKEDEVFELNRKVDFGIDQDLLKTVIGVMMQDDPK